MDGMSEREQRSAALSQDKSPGVPEKALDRFDIGEGDRRRLQDPRALAKMLNALGAAMHRAAEPEAYASVRKAEIDCDLQKKALDVEADMHRRHDEHDQERFRWILGGAYGFSAALLMLAIVLIAKNQIQVGLLIISHMVTLSVGVLGGRGMASKRRHDRSEDQQG